MYESDNPYVPWFTFNPVNIRPMLQRQIDKTVAREIDAAIGAKIGGTDHRFSSSTPTRTIQLISPSGKPYFLAGISLVNCVNVAAP